MTATRRLAAILAADVAGYSRLIGDDEEGTLNRLKSIRAEVVDPSIAQYRGRIVKTTGDGLLGEFASVVDALKCACEIQTIMAEGNAKITDGMSKRHFGGLGRKIRLLGAPIAKSSARITVECCG
jgi:class 3 adenylate cyclase